VESLSRRIARQARAIRFEGLPQQVVDKVKIGLLDLLSCVYESKDIRLPAGSDVAFTTAVLGHGLVREDMHTGSVSHLGVVVYPALLDLVQTSLIQTSNVSGRDFIRAAACGYEAGAKLGRALVRDKEFVQFHRPTGTTGPIAAALAGALLLDLDEDATVSAIGLAANTASGLNEWPYSGADDMFFHPGFAARNAVTAVQLAALGARGSETALDGRAGLFASLHQAAPADLAMFDRWEILDVYYKPFAACNYAQTPCQAAEALKQFEDIAGIHVRCSAAAVAYPGCNYSGPCSTILQRKMSIQHCVAAALGDPKLAAITTLEASDEFTAAYPQKQGAEVTITRSNGEKVSHKREDVTPATPEQIRHRFRQSHPQASEAERFVDNLEKQTAGWPILAAAAFQTANRTS
jgi:2-methylcitrate dehydratase PrpD